MTEAPALPAEAHHRRHDPVRRGLMAIGLALAAQLAPARARGWLARSEVRARIAAVLLVVGAVSFLHTLTAVAVAAGAGVVVALSSGLRGRTLAPLWLGVPLFTLALALPACLNLVTPGPPVWVLWAGAPHEVAVTAPGLLVAARFFLRALACVAFTLSLTSATPAPELVSGLRRLGLPRVFGTILTMMQRYLALVLRRAEDLHMARLSRSMGHATVREGQRWAAAGMGLVLLSSLRLAEEVHSAMLSRGYDGDIQTLPGARWGVREGLLMAGSLLLAAGLVAGDRWL